MSRLIPVGLRLATLALRFLLIFFLARLLTVEEVGLYGVLLATISFVVFIFGFDFYTYSTRQLIRSDGGKWRSFLKSQLAFSLVLYALLGPLLVFLFFLELLPWSIVLWFFVLVPLEHVGLEIDRLLVALRDQLGASVGLFLRQATTALIVVPLMWWIPEIRTIEFLLFAWVFFDVVGISCGLLFLRRHLVNQPKGSVDWKWIKLGIKVSIPFLIGTLCLRALFTFDRQIIAIFSDLEVLGAYTLFISIAAGMTQVIHAGVHQFMYPKLVEAAHRQSIPAFKRAFFGLVVQTVVAVVTITALVLLLQPFILAFVEADAYANYSWMLPWAMLATGLYNLSLIPHYALYAFDGDRIILWTTVSAFAVFIVVVALLVNFDPVVAVLGAIGSASVVLLLLKAGFAIPMFRRFAGKRE